MVETALEPAAANGNSRPLPPFIVVTAAPRFSANQLRMIRAATGVPLETVMNDAASIVQAFAWLELRKAGYDTITWDEAGDVPLEFSDETADPTSAGMPTASPHSAVSGG
jgi:hypothetical protein